jgi:hypothetical protein
MAWDLEFKNGDLTGGIATGDDEVIQRIRTRLFRELGEWFLNTASGLPWYQEGKGILGSPLRDKGAVDLFIRKQALGTEGVSRILKLNSLFAAGQREYSIYMQVLLDSGKLVEQTVTVHESVFTAPGMTMSDLTKLMAQNILFSDGETLQQKLENGAFVGPEGKPGEDGTAATLSVGKVTTGAPGTEAAVQNTGTDKDAVLWFTIPRGEQGIQGIPGIDGVVATVAVGAVRTGEAGSNAKVTNSGTESAAVLDFVIPQGVRGEQGIQGKAAQISVGAVITGEPGTQASVTNSGTDDDAVLDFVIPRGNTGETGAKGDKGDKGDTGATGQQGPKGDKGDSGLSYSVKGAVVSGTTYAANDIVFDPDSNTAYLVLKSARWPFSVVAVSEGAVTSSTQAIILSRAASASALKDGKLDSSLLNGALWR